MENFEEFLKNEADHFKMQPSEKVWEGVRTGLQKPARRFVWWYVAAAMLLISGGIGTYLFLDHHLEVIPVSHLHNNPEKNITNENSQGPTSASSVTNGSKSEQSYEINQNKSTIAVQSETKEKLSINRNNSTRNIPSNKTGKVIDNNKVVNNTPAEVQTEKKEIISQTEQHSTNSISGLSQKSIVLLPVVIIENGITLLQYDPLRKVVTHRKLTSSVSVGINVSKPVSTGYNDFVKPGISYNFQFLLNYKFAKRLGVIAGIGYQQNSHKIGVVTSTPELISVPTKNNGSITETAEYRLNNESKFKNISRQLILPVALNYTLFYNRKSACISVFTGMDFSQTLSANYIIKNTENDKLFSDNKLLRNFNTYSTLGLIYSKTTKRSLNFFCSLKIQYQNGNTYKSDYPLKEHNLISGLNLGISF